MEEFVQHYQIVDEEKRLTTGWGRLEFARTQELIGRYLPPAPAVVLDVGGASGIYSGWLGGLGYESHVVDPVSRHIELARRDSRIASAEIGDGRALAWPDASVDAVLQFGPLYHLTSREERVRALSEAARVLRPGGVVFGAAISRFASLLDGLVRGFIDDPQFGPILDRDLVDGQHRNPTDKPEFFTTAFFHRPEELAEEVAAGGFADAEVLAVEGPGWLAQDFDALWGDHRRRTRLMDLLRRVEREALIMGVSLHLLGIGRR